MAWTAFIDESGLFEPTAHAWLPGLRLVAGVVLPLAPEQAEVRAREALDGALATQGLEGVFSIIHASDLTDERRLAEALLRSERCPDVLRARAQRADRAPGTLSPVGIDALTALRRAVGTLLPDKGGWALGVSEFGRPTTVRGEPGPLPYPRMIQAWLEHAVMELALREQGPSSLHVVVAHRGGHLPALHSLWESRLTERSGERAHVHLTTSIQRAQDSAGLQVADLFAHALGPGALQLHPPTEDVIARRTEAGLATLIRQRFHTSIRYLERDANIDYRLVNRATHALGREVAFEHIAEEAQGLPPTPLPPGHFPASLQACARTVPSMRRLWA